MQSRYKISCIRVQMKCQTVYVKQQLCFLAQYRIITNATYRFWVVNRFSKVFSSSFVHYEWLKYISISRWSSEILWFVPEFVEPICLPTDCSSMNNKFLGTMMNTCGWGNNLDSNMLYLDYSCHLSRCDETRFSQ